ncbi:DISARM system phospholipase D-like protein DrmC [Pannus brasiliensis]
MSPLNALDRSALLTLATALESKRLSPPFHPASLDLYVPTTLQGEVAGELDRLYRSGMSVTHLIYLLQVLASEKEKVNGKSDRIDIVWTGQNVPGLKSRATSVVVRELFEQARKYILVSSYVFQQGDKARTLFSSLANRMDNAPRLDVKLLLDIQRQSQAYRSDTRLIEEFAKSFRQIWPGERLPEVFFDPRSLSTGVGVRACLHAKCIVIDDEQFFITSANLTEAAQERNIEVGVLIKDAISAYRLRTQFETLISRNIVQRLNFTTNR